MTCDVNALAHDVRALTSQGTAVPRDAGPVTFDALAWLGDVKRTSVDGGVPTLHA
jgi:hypothetical protein